MVHNLPCYENVDLTKGRHVYLSVDPNKLKFIFIALNYHNSKQIELINT